METIYYNTRKATAYIASPIMRITGFRFSTDYRHGKTAFHRIVYAIVSTPIANSIADGIR